MESLPSLNDAEEFKENDAVNYTKSVLTLLRTKSNIENEKVLKDLTYRLSSTYFDYQDFLEKVCDILITSGYCKIAYDIIILLIQSNKLQSESLGYILNVLINYSDYSLSFAKNILSSKIINLMITFCIDNQNKNFLSITEQNNLMCSIINVIHNVTRFSENVLLHDIESFKQALLKIIQYNKSDKLGILSVLTLSFIIQESEVKLLDQGVNVVGILINKITSINPVDQRSSGFTVKELLNGLRSLSANDILKTKISTENGIPLFFEILAKKYSDEEKELTLRILWNLCFNQGIKETLKKDYNLEEVLAQFKDTKNKAIIEDCHGILWLLNNKDNEQRILQSSQSRQSDQLSDFKFDVFISYSREYKSTITDIKNGIIESKLRVWIDDEQMFGSTIEAMANGIENSRVFIIAMSKAYTESPNCRCEAEYAFKLRKPIIPVVMQLKYKPMSWLGFIVGTKMYYEFSERRDPKETMTGIVNSIRFVMDEKQESEEVIVAEKCSVVKTESGDKIRKLTKSNITKWLENSNLGHMKKSLKELDGSLLEVLIDVKNKSPEYFNHTLKHEFGMKFIDVLKFHKALNSL